MKKTLWIAVAGALVASVVAASAAEVLSANAVGYIKRTLPGAGGLQTFSTPLNPMSGTLVFSNISVAADAAAGTRVYFWSTNGTPAWVGGVKAGTTLASWGTWANYPLQPGEAFFLKSPAAAAAKELTITGEVPDDATIAKGMLGGGNLNLLANPYPVDTTFGATTNALLAAAGSRVYFWNGTAWVGGVKAGTTVASWGTWANYPIAAGEGYMLKENGSSRTWSDTKPYSWP